MKHSFTTKIEKILQKNFEADSKEIFQKSLILQYINIKTKSANKGSKARGSFANLYAIYVLVEDYIQKGFNKKKGYTDYEGASFSQLFKRQRELPFGNKLQNHALNHRLNEEFRKFFPTSEQTPILRNLQTNRYWFNENLLKIKIGKKEYNLAQSLVNIIDKYVKVKKETFEQFIKFCENAKKINREKLFKFIIELIQPNVDARIFEIVSYSILKFSYVEQNIYWGFELKKIKKDNLKLFKTGRTNANDGGIDFVMKPLGRFFQVTETTDVNKYFLDIDKIERYPITFVVKSNLSIKTLKNKMRLQAQKQFSIKIIVEKYMNCIEEVINIPILLKKLKQAQKQGNLDNILNEIIKQSKLEYNFDYDEFSE